MLRSGMELECGFFDFESFCFSSDKSAWFSWLRSWAFFLSLSFSWMMQQFCKYSSVSSEFSLSMTMKNLQKVPENKHKRASLRNITCTVASRAEQHERTKFWRTETVVLQHQLWWLQDVGKNENLFQNQNHCVGEKKQLVISQKLQSQGKLTRLNLN